MAKQTRTARISGTRCTPEEKQELEEMAHKGGYGRTGIWAMIFAAFLRKKTKRRPTPRQEAIDRQFDTLKDMYREAKEITDREEKAEVLSAIQVLAKWFIKLRDDRQVQPSPKRPAADRIPDRPGGQ